MSKKQVKVQKSFLDLTDDEVRELVQYIFEPKKITCIKRNKKWDEITCKIYTEWNTTEDDGTVIPELIPDELTLKNPFDYGEEALHVDFQLHSTDYFKMKQYCYAKGIYGVSIKWLFDNPFLKNKIPNWMWER